MKRNSPLSAPLLSVTQAAEWLGVSRDTVFDAIKRGILKATNVSVSEKQRRPLWRIHPSDLQRFASAEERPRPVVVESRRFRPLQLPAPPPHEQTNEIIAARILREVEAMRP